MGTAVLNPATPAPPPRPLEAESAPASVEALRQQAAARVAAHRSRRERIQGGATTAPRTHPADSAAPAPGDKSRIAAAVAERYAQAQSYRAFLAAEAERAVQQARAAAEVAARNARVLAEAQQQLMDRLARESAEQARASAAQAAEASHSSSILEAPALWPDLAPETTPRAATAETSTRASSPSVRREPEPAALAPEPATLRVVLYEEIPPKPPVLHAQTRSESAPGRPARYGNALEDTWDLEASRLDEEISFRQAPVFEEPAGPPMALPANLIEFPRQLVAARKARPRYAEGPLRDEQPAPNAGSQLRIFEVDPGQIATAADPFWTTSFEDAVPSTEPQWTSLWLDTPSTSTSPASHYAPATGLEQPADSVPGTAPQLYPAAWSRRGLAAAVDAGIIATATLAFAAGFAALTGHLGAYDAARLAQPDAPGISLLSSAAASIACFFSGATWTPAALLEGATHSLRGLPVLTGLGALAATGGALALAYQVLWFTFSDATPGMRFARVGLCTFSDDNPTRRAMRRRIPALLLSTLLFGIGFLWALLDEDGLPWHDLISRMYPRSY